MGPERTWPLAKPPGECPSPVDAAVTSVSPWSEVERSPVLLEVQWKAMTQEEAGWRREEGSPGQVEGASDLQAFVWSPSDGRRLCEPTSCPGHCQADGGGMYGCLGSGILSLGEADKALICGPIPGQALNVGKGTGRGDRPCLSIRRGQDQSLTLRVTDGTESPWTGCKRRVRRNLSYGSAGGRGWTKGVFHRAQKELRPLRSRERGSQHRTARTHVDRRRLRHHDDTRQRTSS